MSDPVQLFSAIKIDEKDIVNICKNKKLVAKLSAII